MGFNLKVILKILGAVSMIIACFMIPALIVSVIYTEYSRTRDFGILFGVLFIVTGIAKAYL